CGPAAAATPNFRYERPISPSAAGANRLDVDVPLLAGARPLPLGGHTNAAGLEDLRFYDAAGAEVPYLLLRPERPAPQWQSAQLLPITANEASSGVEIDLGGAVHCDQLHLTGLPAPLLKRFGLEGSGDRLRWTTLIADGTLFDLPEQHLQHTEI